MNLIVKMKFGSHLYGTDTPESDLDYKGVFMPSKEQIFLGKIPKSYSESTKKGNEDKNTADDIDTEIYSLHYFIELSCQGQTVALDMLHAPKSMVIYTSDLWSRIASLRSKFYTRDLKAFVGYARRQAAKYGIKGSRIAAAKKILSLLPEDYERRVNGKMKDIWDKLPEDEHLYHVEPSPNGLRQYQVCGKILQETQSPEYVKVMLTEFVRAYGKRAKMAERNEGIDWKAVSHALRAAYQTKQILTKNTIVFPLPEAEFLRSVKQGKLDYLTEVVPVLERLMDEVEDLSAKSELPKKVNRKYWEHFIVSTIENYYGFY